MRCIGVDYGKKRVGIALSDETGTIATPLLVLPNDATLASKVVTLANERGATKIVLGASYDFQGKENPIMNDIKAFQEKLSEATKLSIRLESEVLTSVQARRHESDPALRDASAAALILQSYLDRRKA